MFDVFHVNRSNDRRDARAHRSAIDLFEKRVFVGNTAEEKQCSRPIVMSEISREVREAKDSSEERRSKTRPRALSTGTDVNKLSTSKETKMSFSDIVKFLT